MNTLTWIILVIIFIAFLFYINSRYNPIFQNWVVTDYFKMSRQKWITILIVIAAILLFIASRYSTYYTITEKFWTNPSRTWKVEKLFKYPNSQDFFSSPNFQATLSPRFSNVNYGPNLRNQFPNYNRLGVPQDPLNENQPNVYDPLKYDNVMGKIDNCNCSKCVNPYQPYSKEMSNCECNVKEYKQPCKIPLDPHNNYSNAYTNGNYDEVLNKVVQCFQN